VQNAIHDRRLGKPLPHLLIRGRFPEHDPHGVDVRTAVDRFAGQLLRGHVVHLALDHAHLGVTRRSAHLGDAEVEQLHPAVVGDEYVLRAHVAMHDLERGAVEVRELVRVVQPGERFADHFEAHGQGEPVRRPHDDAGIGLPFEVAHDDHRQPVVLDDLVDFGNVRMVEAGREPRLGEEHAPQIGIGGEGALEDLQHHQLVEAARAARDGEKHVGGPPFTKGGKHPVLPRDVARSDVGLFVRHSRSLPVRASSRNIA
jgi:hypothetical protein